MRFKFKKEERGETFTPVFFGGTREGTVGFGKWTHYTVGG